jgi:predicted Rossmann fold nucleotide-binding protein DprA/Smf involved in DNA uptake
MNANQMDFELDQGVSVFQLMGDMNLSNEERNKYLRTMAELIWKEFVVTRLGLLLTESQTEQVTELLNKENGYEDAMELISRELPSLGEIMAEFAQEKIIQIVEERYSQEIKDMDDLIERENMNIETVTKAKRRLEKYKIAQRLLGGGKLKELVELMAS